MKKRILNLIIILFFCSNTLFSQTKTPYQKRTDQIMKEMCLAIGVNNTLIQMAIKQNDWDIVRTSQDLAFKSRMLDKNQLLVIIFSTEKKLKEAEKLKNNIDLNRDAEKKAKEKNEKLAIEKKIENEKKDLEKKNLEEELKDQYLNSDYISIINNISNEFNLWLKKGEFEKTEDYLKRIEKRELIFLEICNKTVLQQIEIKEEIHTDEYDTNYEEKVNESFQLLEYNADKEIFPFMYKYKFIQFNDTIHVPLKDAQKFKENTNYNNIHLSKNKMDYQFIDNYIYSKKIIVDNIEGKKSIEVELNTNKPTKSILFSTKDLKLTNYTYSEIIFDFNEYKSRKTKLLIQEAEIVENFGDFDKALELYKKILEFNTNSVFTKNKISSINEKINEIVRTKLIGEAEKLISNGQLSESKQKYIEANKLRNTKEISEIITNIDNNLSDIKNKHNEITKEYNYSLLNLELSKDSKLNYDLEKIKKDYKLKYNSCLDIINSLINRKKIDLSNQNENYLIKINKEVWSNENQEFLNSLISFNSDYIVLKSFEDNIFKALENDDKKFLKILKEEDEKIIIKTVINPKEKKDL